MTKTYDLDQARGIATELGIDFTNAAFDLAQFRIGLDVEAEHGAADPETNVTNDDPIVTGKIALAHLREMPDYYTRLAMMEAAADAGGAEDMLTSGGRSTRRRFAVMAAMGMVIVLVAVVPALVRKARSASCCTDE